MFWGMIRRQADDGEDVAVKADVGLLVIFAIVIPLVSFLAYNRDYGYNETWYRYTISYGAAIAFFALCSSRARIDLPGCAISAGSATRSIFSADSRRIVCEPASTAGDAARRAFYIGITMVLAVAMASIIYRLVERRRSHSDGE